MFNFLKHSATMKLEETNDICKELGDNSVQIIGAAVKQGACVVNNRDIDYKLTGVELVSKILNKSFECEALDCIVALHTAVDFTDGFGDKFEDYAKEYITCLNICNMSQRLQICYRK